MRALCIGDTHFPYVDRKKLDAVYDIASDLKPNLIVQVGDLYDLYCFSRFKKSIDYITPAKEIEYGRTMAEEMWTKLRRIAPNARRFQLHGNHELRLWNKLLTAAPEFESLLKEPIANLMRFSQVYSFRDSRSMLTCNGIVFHHGWTGNTGDHARWLNRSAVVGHLHRGGLRWLSRFGEPIFELNCGFLSDMNQKPMEYNEMKAHSCIAGVGLIAERGPQFIQL